MQGCQKIYLLCLMLKETVTVLQNETIQFLLRWNKVCFVFDVMMCDILTYNRYIKYFVPFIESILGPIQYLLCSEYK